jgi:hypothetical protein
MRSRRGLGAEWDSVRIYLKKVFEVAPPDSQLATFAKESLYYIDEFNNQKSKPSLKVGCWQ